MVVTAEMVEAARESKKVKIPLVAAELRRLVHSSYCWRACVSFQPVGCDDTHPLNGR